MSRNEQKRTIIDFISLSKRKGIQFHRKVETQKQSAKGEMLFHSEKESIILNVSSIRNSDNSKRTIGIMTDIIQKFKRTRA